MLNFPKLQLTNQGKILIAESLKGIPFTFTKFQLGSGTPLVVAANMTALAHAVISAPITRAEQTGAGAITLSAAFDNGDIVNSFSAKELGLFAQQDGESEVLYAYAYEGESPSVIPSYPSHGFMEEVFAYTVAVGDAEDFSVNIDTSALQYSTGAYTGDGEVGRVISVGFTPGAVIVQPLFIDPDHASDLYGGLAVAGKNIVSDITAAVQRESAITAWSDTYCALGITTGGFKVNFNASNKIRTNDSGRMYAYIAFK